MTKLRALVLAVLALVAGVAITPSPVRAADTFTFSSGGASGSVMTARVFYGGLSIPVPIGEAAATFEAGRARALGAVVSAGTVGSLTGVNVPGTTASTVDSAREPRTLNTKVAEPFAGVISLEATKQPASRGEVALADLDLPGALRVGGGVVKTASKVVGGQRQAEAVVTIASVSLAGGAVELTGLRWSTSHRSTGTGAPTTAGSFSLGGLNLAGVQVPLPVSPAALQDVVTLVNSTLKSIGIAIALPVVERLPDGSINVGALKVKYGKGVLGTEVVGPILSKIRPLLLPVLEAIVNAQPSLGVATLLADLGLGVADGSGGVEILVGGANAFTGEKQFGNPLAALLPIAPIASAILGAAPATLSPYIPAVPSSPELVSVTGRTGPARCALAAGPRRQGGCRWSHTAAAVAVGAVALFAIAAYEVTSRRRRAT